MSRRVIGKVVPKKKGGRAALDRVHAHSQGTVGGKKQGSDEGIEEVSGPIASRKGGDKKLSNVGGQG